MERASSSARPRSGRERRWKRLSLCLVCILSVTVSACAVTGLVTICSLLAQGFSAAGTLASCTTLTQIGMAVGAVGSIASGASYLMNPSESTTTTEWAPPTDGTCDDGGPSWDDEGQVVPVGFFPESYEEGNQRRRQAWSDVVDKVTEAYRTRVKYGGDMPATPDGIERALTELKSAHAGVEWATAQLLKWYNRILPAPVDFSAVIQQLQYAQEERGRLAGLIKTYEAQRRV